MKFEMDDMKYVTKQSADGRIVGCVDVEDNFEECQHCAERANCPVKVA